MNKKLKICQRKYFMFCFFIFLLCLSPFMVNQVVSGDCLPSKLAYQPYSADQDIAPKGFFQFIKKFFSKAPSLEGSLLANNDRYIWKKEPFGKKYGCFSFVKESFVSLDLCRQELHTLKTIVKINGHYQCVEKINTGKFSLQLLGTLKELFPLNQNETAAIHWYTQNDLVKNRALKKSILGEVAPENFDSSIPLFSHHFQHLQSAMRKWGQCLVKENIYHGRREDLKEGRDYEGIFKENEIIQNKLLLSFSLNKKIAGAFARQVSSTPKGKEIYFILKAKKSVPAFQVSHFPYEQELLIPPGARLKILKIKETKNKKEVFLEELL